MECLHEHDKLESYAAGRMMHSYAVNRHPKTQLIDGLDWPLAGGFEHNE